MNKETPEETINKRIIYLESKINKMKKMIYEIYEIHNWCVFCNKTIWEIKDHDSECKLKKLLEEE